MYPTVNSLMGLWHFVVAQEIIVRKRRKREVLRFLRQVGNPPNPVQAQHLETDARFCSHYPEWRYFTFAKQVQLGNQ